MDEYDSLLTMLNLAKQYQNKIKSPEVNLKDSTRCFECLSVLASRIHVALVKMGKLDDIDTEKFTICAPLLGLSEENVIEILDDFNVHFPQDRVKYLKIEPYKIYYLVLVKDLDIVVDI